MVVSRCRGIGPPSGFPSSGLCFCWPPTTSSSNACSTRPRRDLDLTVLDSPSRQLATCPRGASTQASAAGRRAAALPVLLSKTSHHPSSPRRKFHHFCCVSVQVPEKEALKNPLGVLRRLREIPSARIKEMQVRIVYYLMIFAFIYI